MEDIAWRTDAHVCAPVCLDFDKLSAVRYPVGGFLIGRAETWWVIAFIGPK